MRFLRHLAGMLAAFASPLLAQGSCLHPLAPIPGFEVRLLDRKLPLEITFGNKVESHDLPIWLFMPRSGEQQADINPFTVPNELAGGTALLPPPIEGFGLKALLLPVRENLVFGNGQVAMIEVPVFIYYRKFPLNLPAGEVRAAPATGTPGSSTEVADKAAETGEAKALEEARRELAQMCAQLAELKQEFTAFIRILPDGTAREQLKILIAKMASLGLSLDGRVAYNPDGTIDTNIK